MTEPVAPKVLPEVLNWGTDVIKQAGEAEFVATQYPVTQCLPTHRTGFGGNRLQAARLAPARHAALHRRLPHFEQTRRGAVRMSFINRWFHPFPQIR